GSGRSRAAASREAAHHHSRIRNPDLFRHHYPDPVWLRRDARADRKLHLDTDWDSVAVAPVATAEADPRGRTRRLRCRTPYRWTDRLGMHVRAAPPNSDRCRVRDPHDGIRLRLVHVEGGH